MNNFTEKVKELFTKHQAASIAVTSVVVVAAISITIAVMLLNNPVQAAVFEDESSSDTSSINVVVPDIIKNDTSSDTSSQNVLSIDVKGDVDVNVSSTPQAEPSVVNVTGIKLSTTDITLTVGNSRTPIVTMTPSNATNKGEIWESSNTAIATVNSSGKIIAKSVGTCVVTVKSSSNNGISAIVNVTVNAAQTTQQQTQSQQQTTTSSQTTTPHLPDGVDPATAGATGEICPWCGKEIWNDSKYFTPSNPIFLDEFDHNKYCLGLEGLQLG